MGSWDACVAGRSPLPSRICSSEPVETAPGAGERRPHVARDPGQERAVAAAVGADQPGDPAVPVQPRARTSRWSGRCAARPAQGQAIPWVVTLRRRVRRAADGGVDHVGFGAVRAGRVLDRRGVRRARHHPDHAGHGGGPLLRRRRAAPARGVHPAGEPRRPGGWWKSSGSARKASGCGSCTSTGPGGTTCVTR